jgi:plasmid stabilization system protein ParE
VKVRLVPEADEELVAAARWYEDRGRGLGERFISEVSQALRDIEHAPTRYPRMRYRTSREIRRRVLHHFPYVIVYEVRESECRVAAIAHAARRPMYWRSRLE